MLCLQFFEILITLMNRLVYHNNCPFHYNDIFYYVTNKKVYVFGVIKVSFISKRRIPYLDNLNNV